MGILAIFWPPAVYFVTWAFPCLSMPLLTDGMSAPAQLRAISPPCKSSCHQAAQICTVIGRYYALDRDNRWERVQTAYSAIAQGAGAKAATAQEVIERAYAEGQTDEFIPASVIGDYAGMRPQDGLLCLNFRADRAREILAALCQPDFAAFDTAPAGHIKRSDGDGVLF
jgi:2,3-bisphosphoglycerate-independent phosphoglycerate mutase